MATFTLSIITPDGHVFEGQASSLVAPGEEGYIGILADHAPMVCSLKPGVLTLKDAEDKTSLFAVGEGVLEVQNNLVSLLADCAYEVGSEEDAHKRVKEILPTPEEKVASE